MPGRRKSGIAAWMSVAVAMSVVLASGCRNHARPGDGDSGTAGEPEHYSATVVRIVEDGTRRETNTTREARAGERRWEEWTQNGQNRALIWRPDLGKAFLLDMDGRAYIEIAINPERPGPQLTGNGSDGLPRGRQSGGRDLDDGAFQAIDRLIEEPLSPTSVETRMVPDEKVEGYLCSVSERRAIFADGHIEVTKVFRARDLGGLALRVELEGTGNQKVITERRDVRTEVSADAFVVPGDFKKVDKIEHK